MSNTYTLFDGTVIPMDQLQLEHLVEAATTYTEFTEYYGPVDEHGIPAGMLAGVQEHLKITWQTTKDHFLLGREYGDYQAWGDTEFERAVAFVAQAMLETEPDNWPSAQIDWMDVIEIVHVLQHDLNDVIKNLLWADFSQQTN